ncbi:Hypothetical protein PHPALM_6775 [Phytophthora palmivora]|uniref:M96 mating-specific protein family n=1 Tax=Phytophthora palmivora TaxID=4796 RepID=A0A2P4YE10_9STRA|nr:Hypothetical protein PHPALM_6775 [Phytophthora palmivora]
MELQLALYQSKRSSTIPNKQFQWGGTKISDEGCGLWKGFAVRQLKERLRVEQKHQKLKQSQNEMTQLCGELKKLLEQWGSCENMVGLMGNKGQLRFRDLKVDDEVYSELLVAVARFHLEMRRKLENPCRTIYLKADFSMGKDIARLDPSVEGGVVFDRHSCFLLPFNLDVVVRACWRFFHCDQSTELSTDQEHELLVMSFSVKTNFENFTAKVQGKYACRKFVDTDSAVLTWVGLSGVSEYGGSEFRGMQLHKQGCIKLRKVASKGAVQQSSLTVAETRFKTTPVFGESVTDSMQQTKLLIDSFNSSYSTINGMFCQVLGELLIQEDWKAMFEQK